MKTKTSVETGNAHLEALIAYTRRMVKANRIKAEQAPEFMTALSDAMMSTVARFEAVVETVGSAAVAADMSVADVSSVTGSSGSDAPKTRHPRTAKLREKLLAHKEVDPAAPLPPIVQAHRYVAPKRPVGRPRKDAQPIPMTPKQIAFDKAFLARFPPLAGLSADNTVQSKTITVLMDGKKMKMIKRHLLAKYGISFEDYKRIYSLPNDYPSRAPGYAKIRRRHALRQGLGTDKVPKRRMEDIGSKKVVPINPSFGSSVAA